MAEFSENDFILSLNNFLPDNSTEQISPKDVRDVFTNAVDSTHRFLELHSIKALNIESAHLRQTKVGELALDNLDLTYESGVDNTAVGYSSLGGNVFGKENTAAGSYSLSCNLDGNYNTAIGCNSLVGSVEGDGNVGVGLKTLYGLRNGDFNIAIGHGAGYYIGKSDSYQFYLGAHSEASGCCCLDGSGTPLLRGDLQELKLAVGTNELHNYGTLQVSGDASPTVTRTFDLGNDNRAWRSVNGQLQFPTSDTVKSTSRIIPCYDGLALGSTDLRWDGFFRDVQVYGDLTVHGDTVCGSGSGVRFNEGFFEEDLAAPTDFCSPTSGLWREKRTCGGVCEDGDLYYAINRDTNLEISSGTYSQFAMQNGEWRPIWSSCAAIPVPTTTQGPTTTTTQGPTTTTTQGPTTTTTQGPTTTTTAIPSFGFAGCEALDVHPSAEQVLRTVDHRLTATFPSFPSGAKSIFINTSFQGDAENPSSGLYETMRDKGNAARQVIFADSLLGCDIIIENPDASGWGSGFMALQTDGQVVPANATLVNPITLANFKTFVDELDYQTWPANRAKTQPDSGSSGVLILGYHDRCGPMTELSGIVAASSDVFYNYMRCNGVIWVRGAHTSGNCLDIVNMNFVLKELLCESKFSSDTDIQLQGSSVLHTDLDALNLNPSLHSGFDLGYPGSLSGGSKLCVPDASGFYVYNENLGIAMDLFGQGKHRSINSGDLFVDTDRASGLRGNVVDPIFIHSGVKNPYVSPVQNVVGQYYSSGVFTMVHEFTVESGYKSANCDFPPWGCCDPQFNPHLTRDCQICECAKNRFDLYIVRDGFSNIDFTQTQAKIDTLPDGCVKDDIQDAFDYYQANCPCTTTTTTTQGPTTTSTTQEPCFIECTAVYGGGPGGGGGGGGLSFPESVWSFNASSEICSPCNSTQCSDLDAVAAGSLYSGSPSNGSTITIQYNCITGSYTKTGQT